MIKNPQLTVTRISWKAVAREVSKLAGKVYPTQYIREVSRGDRTNNQLKPILEHLGVMQEEAA